MNKLLRSVLIRTLEPSLGEEDVWYVFSLFPLVERRWHCGNFVYDWYTQYCLARWPVRLWRRIFGFRKRGFQPPISFGPPPPEHINCRCMMISKKQRLDEEGSP